MINEDINKLVEQLIKDKINSSDTDKLIKDSIHQHLRYVVDNFVSTKTVNNIIKDAVNNLIKSSLPEMVKNAVDVNLGSNRDLKNLIDNEFKKVSKDTIKQLIGDRIAKRLNIFLEVLDKQLQIKV